MRDWPTLHPRRQRHVRRLRWAGRAVLGVAACVAVLVYRIGSMNHSPTMQELLPGTARAIERQRGILFGRAGAEMIGWFDVFGEPIGHAALIVVAGIVGAVALYQIAHEIEVEEG